MSIRDILERIKAQSLHPHEIDGDVFPEGVEEFDATETLPNPLDTLKVDEQQKISLSTKGKLPTSPNDGAVGRIVSVPATPAGTVPGRPTEVLTIKLDDDMNSVFQVALTNVPDPIQPHESGAGSYQATPNVNVNRSDVSYFIVEFGAGGAQFQVQVDAIPGQTISIGGSFLRVSAVNYSSNNLTQDFGAFVSLLPKGTRLSAKKTIPRGLTLPAGITLLASIPLFSKKLRVYRNPASNPFSVQFLAGGVVFSETNVAANADCPSIEIPGRAQQVQFVNTGAANSQHEDFIFELDL